jgi:hypothetical protein
MLVSFGGSPDRRQTDELRRGAGMEANSRAECGLEVKSRALFPKKHFFLVMSAPLKVVPSNFSK